MKKMPILKYDRLKDLMEEIKKDGYVNEITTIVLHKYIGKHFGIGIGTRKNINKMLVDWGFIKEKSFGVWMIIRPNIIDEDKRRIEKMEKELIK